MASTVRQARVLVLLAVSAAIATCGAGSANATISTAQPKRVCLVKERSGTAEVCVTRLDKGGWAFRLSGFQPKSTYRVRIPGAAYGFDTKVDSSGTTDGGAGLRPEVVRGIVPGLVVAHGFTVTGKDNKGRRIRVMVPAR